MIKHGRLDCNREEVEANVKRYNMNAEAEKTGKVWRVIWVAVFDAEKFDQTHKWKNDPLHFKVKKGTTGYYPVNNEQTDEWLLENWGLLRLRK